MIIEFVPTYVYYNQYLNCRGMEGNASTHREVGTLMEIQRHPIERMCPGLFVYKTLFFFDFYLVFGLKMASLDVKAFYIFF